MTFTLTWQGLILMKAVYSVSVQLIGPAWREVAAPGVWAQRDAPPCVHTYLSGHWQTGHEVWDDLFLVLPADGPAGDYRLANSMYKLATGERLRT
jgi:hypothetical protein